MAPLRERVESALERGLSTKIAEDNIGFAMLAKMGYQYGLPKQMLCFLYFS
jgi:hypothetical protein